MLNGAGMGGGLVAGLMLVLVFASCTFPLSGGVPVAWSDVRVVFGDHGELHSVAGLYHTVRNLSDSFVVELTIAFDLYDTMGRPYPEPGKNSFISVVTCDLPPETCQSFCTRLDEVLPSEPEPVEVSRFRVRRLRFGDDSEWVNRFGPAGGDQ